MALHCMAGLQTVWQGAKGIKDLLRHPQCVLGKAGQKQRRLFIGSCSSKALCGQDLLRKGCCHTIASKGAKALDTLWHHCDARAGPFYDQDSVELSIFSQLLIRTGDCPIMP